MSLKNLKSAASSAGLGGSILADLAMELLLGKAQEGIEKLLQKAVDKNKDKGSIALRTLNGAVKNVAKQNKIKL